TGAPNSQASVRSIARDQVRQDKIAESLEVLRMTKEIGLSDSDLGRQRVQLRGTVDRVAQNVEVRGAVARACACQPVAQPAYQIGVLVNVIDQPGGRNNVLLQARVERVVHQPRGSGIWHKCRCAHGAAISHSASRCCANTWNSERHMRSFSSRTCSGERSGM